MFGLPEEIVIYDCEYATWEGAMKRNWTGPGEYKETIQIAAILIETSDFSEIDEFQVFIKPVKNLILSDYFIELTHISQQEVDEKGIDFSEALQMFYKWSRSYFLYSFGADHLDLIRNCSFDFVDIEFPFDVSRFFNMRDIFEIFGVSTKGYTSGTIVKAFGEEIKQRPHNAFNDVKTIIEGLKFLKKQTKKL